MANTIGWGAPSNEKAARAGAASRSAVIVRNEEKRNPKAADPQAGNRSQHASLAAQYREAAARNADAGRELGGQQGFALISLAEHFGRRAHQHAVAAGGA